jgi:hypothetical protein
VQQSASGPYRDRKAYDLLIQSESGTLAGETGKVPADAGELPIETGTLPGKTYRNVLMHHADSHIDLSKIYKE